MKLMGAVVMSLIGMTAFIAPSAGATFQGGNGDLLYSFVDVSGKALYNSTGVSAFSPATLSTRFVSSCFWDGWGDDCSTFEGAASANGERIAVVVVDSTGTEPNRSSTYRLAVMAPNGTSVASIHLGRPAFDPAWSPRGDMILVTRYDGATGDRGTGVPRVVLLSTNGREHGPVTPDGGSDADWAANGDIAYTRDGDIWLTRLGQTPKRLTTAGGTSPSWSPDAREIAFERGSRIWVMRADGSGQRQLSHLEANAPAWSPDGRYIAFSNPAALASRDGGDIRIMRSDGTCPRPVAAAAGWVSFGRPFWRPLPTVEPDLRRAPCRDPRLDLGLQDRRIRTQRRSFSYRFAAPPSVVGRAVFRTKAGKVIASAKFTAGSTGIVRIRPHLSRAAQRRLREERALRVTATILIGEGEENPITGSRRLTLLAPRRPGDRQ